MTLFCLSVWCANYIWIQFASHLLCCVSLIPLSFQNIDHKLSHLSTWAYIAHSTLCCHANIEYYTYRCIYIQCKTHSCKCMLHRFSILHASCAITAKVNKFPVIDVDVIRIGIDFIQFDWIYFLSLRFLNILISISRIKSEECVVFYFNLWIIWGGHKTKCWLKTSKIVFHITLDLPLRYSTANINIITYFSNDFCFNDSGFFFSSCFW